LSGDTLSSEDVSKSIGDYGEQLKEMAVIFNGIYKEKSTDANLIEIFKSTDMSIDKFVQNCKDLLKIEVDEYTIDTPLQKLGIIL